MIEIYQKLWANRSGAENIGSQEELENKILIELNDELTHPRVRKSKKEKLELALERIEGSSLTEKEKQDLSALYRTIAAR